MKLSKCSKYKIINSEKRKIARKNCFVSLNTFSVDKKITLYFMLMETSGKGGVLY